MLKQVLTDRGHTATVGRELSLPGTVGSNTGPAGGVGPMFSAKIRNPWAATFSWVSVREAASSFP
jgi:hypothetical protein